MYLENCIIIRKECTEIFVNSLYLDKISHTAVILEFLFRQTCYEFNIFSANTRSLRFRFTFIPAVKTRVLLVKLNFFAPTNS